LIITGALLSVLVYDFLYMEIPMIVVWVATGLALLFNLFFDWKINAGAGIMDSTVIAGIIGALGAFVFFFALSFFSKEKWMGLGDAYLAVPAGLILGWPKIILALFLSFFIGSVYGIILILMGKKKMKSRIPFAPFLVMGVFVSLLFYSQIINWYLALFY
jgi:prepilin signal peptidase PulO-like enzyme (type II secretory pathway)